MKNVEQVRGALMRCFRQFCGSVSQLDGGGEIADMMRGSEGQDRLAQWTADILADLGHPTTADPGSTFSKDRRAVRKAFPKLRGGDGPAIA